MDVSVLFKRGQRRLRLAGRPSVLGQGMLERARATSLALLGLTAAVGLAIVALALNQSWPLLPGSAIPQIPPRHQKVGEARVAAGVGGVGSSRADASGHRQLDTGGQRSGRHARNAGPVPSPAAGVETKFVVSSPSPAESQGDHPHAPPRHSPAQQPQQAVDVPASSPPSASATSPAVDPKPVESTPPGVTTAEVTANDPGSYVPPPTQGNDDGDGQGDDADDQGDDGGWGGHWHGYSHGHHWDD